MVGPLYDCLANPLGAVRLTFEKAMASVSDPSAFDVRDWGVFEVFRNFLFEQDNLSKVPMLNPLTVRWVQPNTLVRFRGMIQDMLGNEFYVGAFKDESIWRTNKFVDVSQFPMPPSPDMRIWERRLLYCVTVPGLNTWAESATDSAVNGHMESMSEQRDKRSIMDIVSSNEFEDFPNAKRMKEDGRPSPSSQSRDSKDSFSGTIQLPQGDRSSFPCLVKIYNSPESDLKLNEVFEFIGVLTFDPELTMEDKDDSDECYDAIYIHLPPNKVPRLHCIIHRKLAVDDFLHNPSQVEPKPHLVKDVRQALLKHLTAISCNDALAAHFILLHLLSRVHTRVDGVAVGKLSLNITCLNKDNGTLFGSQIHTAIKNLLPFTNRIPLTLEYLNKDSFAPRKDYGTNRLIPGVLQLAEGSHLIIDETQLEAGTLSSVGVENVRLLKDLIELQKVEYDFKYYKMEMATDVQLMVLSEGKSNIMPADIIMPFQPSSINSSEVVAAGGLQAWRWYLATVRTLSHTIDSEMQKVVENDLVALRQADRSLGGQDFNRLLTMGRLISASFGEASLSMEHWQMVKELERLRKERLESNIISVNTINQ